MRSPLRKGKPTLIKGVDLARLCPVKGPGRQRQIGVAPRFGENLHLRIYAAEPPVARVCQCEITMHKTVARLSRPISVAEAPMPVGQKIAKLNQLSTRVLL